MLLWILRGSFIAVIIGMATYALMYFVPQNPIYQRVPTGISAFTAIIFVGLTAVTLDVLVRNKQITTISAISFGLLLGLVIGALFSMALEPFLSDNKDLAQPIRLLITLVCCYFFVSTLVQTKDDFRFII